MGIYLNPGDELFWQAVHSEIYVDKTGLLNYTNKVLRTSKKYLCVTLRHHFSIPNPLIFSSAISWHG